MDNSTAHSHTHLYIITGILLVLGIIFFMTKSPVGEEYSTSTTPQNPTPLELKRLVLSPEEMAANEKALADPKATERAKTLTKAQAAANTKALADPRMTERVN